MRTTFFLLLCISMLTAVTSLKSQTDFTPDPEKATVYFVRTSAMGAAINFKYFVDDQYVGKFNHGKYLKVSLDPGTHLLWAKADNIDFLEATLEAGKTYVVNSKATMGMVKAGIRLMPITADLGRKGDKALRALLKHKERVYTEEELAEEAIEWAELMIRSKEKYEKIKAQNREIQALDVAMDLSPITLSVR